MSEELDKSFKAVDAFLATPTSRNRGRVLSLLRASNAAADRREAKTAKPRPQVKDGRYRVAVVAVDSARILIGDPCYVLPPRRGARRVRGMTYDAASRSEDRFKHGFGYIGEADDGTPCLAVLVHTWIGDGSYPLFLTFKDGHAIKIEIDLDPRTADMTYVIDPLPTYVPKRRNAKTPSH